MNILLREIWWTPAYDKRDVEPSRNYGVHGMEITFVLRNAELDKGLTFNVMTNWQLPHVAVGYHPGPRPAFVGIHKLATADADATVSCCEVVNGPCKHDGSALLAREFFDMLVREGVDALWIRMEQQLKDWS